MIPLLRNTLTKACKICDSREWVLTMTKDGFCRSCEQGTLPELEKRTQLINEQIARLNGSDDPESKSQLVETIIEQAEVLAQFEDSGLTFEPSPSALLSKYSAIREGICLEEIAFKFERLEQMSKTATTEACLVEAKKLLWKISEAQKLYPSHSELERFEKQLQGFVDSSEKSAASGLVNGTHLSGERLPSPKTKNKKTDKDFVPDSWLTILESYGVTSSDFLTMKKTLLRNRKRQPRGIEIVWELLNSIVKQQLHSDRPDFRLLQFVYYSMALLAADTRRPHLHLLVESNRMLLMRFKQRGNIDKVQVLTAGKADCQACQEFDRQVLPLQQALELMPIPCENCPFQLSPNSDMPFTCTYVASFDQG